MFSKAPPSRRSPPPTEPVFDTDAMNVFDSLEIHPNQQPDRQSPQVSAPNSAPGLSDPHYIIDEAGLAPAYPIAAAHAPPTAPIFSRPIGAPPVAHATASNYPAVPLQFVKPGSPIKNLFQETADDLVEAVEKQQQQAAPPRLAGQAAVRSEVHGIAREAPDVLHAPLIPQPTHAESKSRPKFPVPCFSFNGRLYLASDRSIISVSVHDVSLTQFIDSPGPLGKHEDPSAISEFLNARACRHEGRRNCCLDPLICEYLVQLLSRTDPTRSGFLIRRDLKNEDEISEFFLRICTGEVPAAINVAKRNAALWPYAIGIAGSVGDQALFGFAVRAFAESKPLGHHPTSNLFAPLNFLLTIINSPVLPTISDEIALDWKYYASVLAPFANSRPPAAIALAALGDALISRQLVPEGHICHLLSGKRSLDPVDDPNGSVALLGVDHRNVARFRALLGPEPLVLSEIFEFAVRSLGGADLMPSLQPFKYAHACLLVELGYTEKAAKYLTFTNAYIKALPASKFSDQFKQQLKDFERRLAGPRQETPPERGLTDGLKGFLFSGLSSVASSFKN